MGSKNMASCASRFEILERNALNFPDSGEQIENESMQDRCFRAHREIAAVGRTSCTRASKKSKPASVLRSDHDPVEVYPQANSGETRTAKSRGHGTKRTSRAARCEEGKPGRYRDKK